MLLALIFTLISVYILGKILSEKSKKGGLPIDNLKQQNDESLPFKKIDQHSCCLILYGTQTNNAKQLAENLKLSVEDSVKGTKAQILSLKEFDPDLFLSNNQPKQPIFVLISTYTDGQPPENASWFCQWLQDHCFDHRVQNNSLANIRFSVFGLGHSEYGKRFCAVARNVDYWLGKMGAKKILPTELGDAGSDLEEKFNTWKSVVIQYLSGSLEFEAQDQKKVAPELEDYITSDEDEDDGQDIGDSSKNNSNFPDGSDSENVMDVEDLGKVANGIKKAVAKREEETIMSLGAKKSIGSGNNTGPKKMVTPMLEKALTKQGYKIVGSHSGVKVCRWTKSMLRGRGGCYKHTFYGIASHQCMETTPSLACANKCVFCWRHHTNPVGTTWRWQMDEPDEIIKGAMDGHYKMIKQLKGVPGVKEQRFKEAFNIRHCALSLVGEPIMYPKINDFVKMLHERRISTFLVTNAQFPEKIIEMEPITQLYVSIDASTKDSLKKIDRPLFSDFWERFLNSLDSLSKKGQRTVYRLTLVKDYNTEDISNYAELIRRGKPDFIEVKGVTFCGYSGASALTMSNVPYQHEVIEFVKRIVVELGSDAEYDIACEHEHSCSVLVASKKFLIDGKWHTWIDYEKFHDLVKEGKPFTSMDYIAPSPDWAIYGDIHKGFDPEETRFHRKKKKKVEIETAKSSGSAEVVAR